ncbi:unnamed protein product [Prorocentrum cordatum]|uniref:Uncharacterized protein n=1 Tax=Prorocentrum cordatum TaxID=2364126 RepID=A0ABN9R8X6_9DINO|nr:unnamed protein product [Polarella glacialis]
MRSSACTVRSCACAAWHRENAFVDEPWVCSSYVLSQPDVWPEAPCEDWRRARGGTARAGRSLEAAPPECRRQEGICEGQGGLLEGRHPGEDAQRHTSTIRSPCRRASGPPGRRLRTTWVKQTSMPGS